MADAPGEKKPSPSEAEVSMKEMWAAAAKSFESICGESLQRGDVKGFDDVRKKIEEASKVSLEPNAAGPEDKWEKAQTVGYRSLKYLKMLVGAGLQASSFFPVPAAATNITSCALFLVFDIPEKIKGYNDAIEQVFGEVSSALSQFQIYTSMEKVDPALIQRIQVVMVSFVKLCAHVVKYRQGRKRDRFKRQLQSIFDDDSGLQDEMATFKRAVEQQRDVEGTLTLATVVETRRDLTVILEQLSLFGKTAEETHQVAQETQKGVQALKDESDRIKTLIKIRDTLSVDPTVRLDTNTTQTCNNILVKCFEGTGSWIWSHEAYTAWTAPAQDKDKETPSHVLIVSGPPSSGKTSIAALITRNLEEQKGRTYVAHYFFPASTKKSDDEKAPVLSAVRYMAFQLARVDATARKSLSKACDAGPQAFRPSSSHANLYKLWEDLKIVTSGSSAVHYLVFDGIENLPDSEAETLRNFVFDTRLGAQSHGRVRVLLSGTPEQFDKFEPQPGVSGTSSALRIRVEEHNEPDMRIIVDEALTKRDMLQHAKPGSDQQRARDNIVDKLPRNVGGSYSRLQFGLDDVIRLLSTRTTIQDLDRVLEQSTSSHEAAIKSLQQSLSAEEIRELNELLKWTLFGSQSMSLSHLEAAMFLYSGTESLASLRYIIKNKYSAVLKIEDDYVYGQDGLEDYLQKVAEASNKSASQRSNSTISMTIQITNVDQEVCGHFLWDLAHKAIRDKFKFDFDLSTHGSAALSSGGGRPAISVSEFEAHQTIVASAFEYLSKEPTDQTWEIGKYLVCWLPYHLSRLRELEDEDKGSLKPSEQFEIGQGLYKLFRDGEVIRRHKAAFTDVYWTADEIENTHKWLMDFSVVRGLDKKWRDEVQRSTRMTRGFLKEIVKFIVEGFLRDRTSNVTTAYWWITTFMEVDQRQTQLPPKPTPPGEAVEEAPVTPHTDDWDAVSAWCQEFLQLSDSELDSLWYERLADLSASWYSGASVTTSLYQRAIDKGNHSWLCHQRLAKTHFGDSEFQEAIRQLNLAMEEAEREGAVPKPEAKDFGELRLLLGEYAYESGDHQKAAESYLAACNSEDKEQAKKGQVGYLRAKLASLDAKETREFLRSKLADEGERASLVEVVKMIARGTDHDAFVWKIFTVAKEEPDLLKDIVHIMETAAPIEKPEPDRNEGPEVDQFAEQESRGVLLFDRGFAAYTYGISPDGTEPIGEALRLWNASRELLADVGGSNSFMARQDATKMLAQHYFQVMVDGRNLDHIDALTRLVDVGNMYSTPSCYLPIVHALRGEKEVAMEAALWRMRVGLQTLSDETPDNDVFGYVAVSTALEQCQDLRQAVVAISMFGQPDLLTQALYFEVDDVEAKEGIDRGKVLELAANTSKEIIHAVKTQIPESSQQVQRIQAAKEKIDALRMVDESTKPEVQADDGDKEESKTKQEEDQSSKDKSEPELAYDLVYSRISALHQTHTPALDSSDESINSCWYCDGRLPDGRRCGNASGFDRDFYHCLFCSVHDFCGECLTRLREGSETTRCSAKHRWLHIPPAGHDMFRGLKARTVRVPKEVRPREDDGQIFEIYYGDGDGDGDGSGYEEMTLEAWKEKIAKEWGISMEEVRREAMRQSEASEGGEKEGNDDGEKDDGEGKDKGEGEGGDVAA